MNIHASPTPPASLEGAPVPARSWFALGFLVLAYTLSFVDRTAVSVVQEKLKSDLGLSDWHIGLMIGPAFAVVYAITSVPMARLAERGNRSLILSLCIGIWSLMAMGCGLARNFVELLVARMGVGIGEAGGNPASHSLIADLFPPRRRATAIAIYTLGAPLGTFLGAAAVGWLAQTQGWRTAFVLLGPPGLVLALLIWWLVPAPRRGTYETAGAGSEVPGFGEVVRTLAGTSAFRHLVSGASLVVLVGYGISAFLPALLIRRYHLPLTEVGLIAGAVSGIGGGLGTMIGGLAGDRWGAGKPRILAIICAIAVVPAAPLMIAGILSGPLAGLIAGAFLGTLAIYAYVAPAFAQIHGMATARSRATVTSIFYLITNLVGLGLGPPLVGAISDAWARRLLGMDAPAFGRFCLHAKEAANPACTAAMAQGMAAALVIVSGLSLIAAVHFLIAARRYGTAPGLLPTSGRT